MAKTISTLKSDLQRKLHGTSLAKLSGVDSLIEEAAGVVLTEIDPAETVRIANIENGIFDQIYDYTAPTDLKGNKVIDIRPQTNRQNDDNFSQYFLEDFDLSKGNNTFTVQYNNAVKTLRLSKEITPSNIFVDTVSGISTNGAWAVGGDASNLTKDTLNYISGGASLNFDLDTAVGSTTGYIENSTLTSQDLSDHEDVGSLFAWVYLPDTSIITNIILRWGNDTSNYWHVTATSPHDQSSFKTGWNLIEFAWNGASEVGSPSSSAVDYLRLTITYDGTAETDIRIDNIFSGIGQLWEIVYYSNALFRNTSGTWSEEISDDSDIINLEPDAYNLLLYQVALLITQEVQGEDHVQDDNFFYRKLYGGPGNKGLYKLYKQSNPSQTEKARQHYYKMPPRTYHN